MGESDAITLFVMIPDAMLFGVRVDELPLTPERVLSLLDRAQPATDS